MEKKFEDYLNAESRVNRTTVQDSRVHCCLYFIAPSGHGYVEFMVMILFTLPTELNLIVFMAV